MAKTRIRRGSRVYVYERENYRDSSGKVKHRNTRYLGIEVTIDGKTQINPPKKRLNEFEITKSVRYRDIAVLYNVFIRPSGLIYYEDPSTSLFSIPGRTIVCFN